MATLIQPRFQIIKNKQPNQPIHACFTSPLQHRSACTASFCFCVLRVLDSEARLFFQHMKLQIHSEHAYSHVPWNVSKQPHVSLFILYPFCARRGFSFLLLLPLSHLSHCKCDFSPHPMCTTGLRGRRRSYSTCPPLLVLVARSFSSYFYVPFSARGRPLCLVRRVSGFVFASWVWI